MHQLGWLSLVKVGFLHRLNRVQLRRRLSESVALSDEKFGDIGGDASLHGLGVRILDSTESIENWGHPLEVDARGRDPPDRGGYLPYSSHRL